MVISPHRLRFSSIRTHRPYEQRSLAVRSHTMSPGRVQPEKGTGSMYERVNSLMPVDNLFLKDN